MQTARQPSPDGSPSAPRDCVALVRVSSRTQARADRAGIARQRRVIEDTIQRKNLHCRHIYEIQDCSGTDVLRNPDIQEILRIVSTGVGLICADLDRLFRPTEPADYVILQTFKDSGSIIYSGDTEYDLANKDSALFANIRSAISGYELALIKERAHGAKESKRRSGKAPNNSLNWPLGLSFHRETAKWFWNPRASDVVAIFQALLHETRNYSVLAKRFSVTPATIRNTASRSLYATGVLEYTEKRGEKRISRTGKVYRVKRKRTPEELIKVKIIDPIVSMEDFEACRKIIAETRFNHHEARKRDQVYNLGAGVARCGHCSEIFLYSSGKRRSGQRSSQAFCK